MTFADEELSAALAECKQSERALADAQRHYREAQETAARAEAARYETMRSADRAETVLLALDAQNTAAVSALTTILEEQALQRRLNATTPAHHHQHEQPTTPH